MIPEVLLLVTLLSCYDGDTCRFKDKVDGEVLVVRIAGIDTPEIKGACDAERRLARVARDLLLEQLKGKTVTLRVRTWKDKYGRMLAAVEVGKLDVGRYLIDRGVARPWTGRRQPWCTPGG